MRHPKRASWPRSAAAAAALAACWFLPAAALADRETPRATEREHAPASGTTAVPRSSTPSTPVTRSSPPPAPSSPPATRSTRESDREVRGPASSTRVPDDRRGDRRDRAERRHAHGNAFDPWWWGYYGRWYGGYWGSIYWGHYGWPWYYPYYPGPYGYGPNYGHYPRRGWDGDLGALDLDVSPAKTEVYLDGEYIGRVDAYDGFPQYLWLEAGTYDLVLFREGYRTIARQVTVRKGVILQIDHELEPGESVRPENLAATSHEVRDRRLRYEREARRRAGAGEDDEEYEERRAEAEAEREDDEDDADEPGAAIGDDDGRDRRRSEPRGVPGRLRLEIRPEDASVYLDGRFLGTGSELARLHSGLLVDRGEHRLAVVRPGYRQRELEFTVDPGEDLELEVELEPGG
jgi:hypothetical protein